MTNHMQSKFPFTETFSPFLKGLSVDLIVNVTGSVYVGGKIAVFFGISHLKVVEEYASAFPCGERDNMITF